jgi:NAD(P)-dependent dehydrogenase (short-subunit alcohol dehydrogenase family)
MAGRVAGKVAFITGAARGQGRAHAIRLAEEGADIVAIDICRDYGDVPYPLASEADLAETVTAVEALDRRIVATVADVRDADALKAAVDDGVAQLGRLDIVSANAGINLGPIYMNTLPVETVDPRDISNAVLFLASDEARYVTGLEFTVDAGNTIR